MSPKKRARQLSVLLTLEFTLEDEVWVGKCRELGTSTFDKDLWKAKEELAELVSLHLNTLESAGEQERFFKEHGIKLLDEVPDHTKVDLPVTIYSSRSRRHVFTESLAVLVGC